MTLESKICLPFDEKGLAAKLKQIPRPLVMTNGVFDVLHRGHVSYLDQAAQLGASLVVAVNTDASARLLGKGSDRPLNKAEDRGYILAGLSSVDLVTFFDTPTPINLLRLIRPDVYVKGGDYDMDVLEETRVVKTWGGKSISIPFVQGFSTTSLVKRIRESGGISARKAAFLDRDGVINKDKEYVHKLDDFEFVPSAVEGMRLLQNAGYALVVVTNQSGLARGYYTEQQYQDLTASMRNSLEQQGVQLAGVYHCPHHPAGSVSHLAINCDCRKPAPGMLKRAARELNLSLPDSIMIGDKISDIHAARAAGVGRAYLVDSFGISQLQHESIEADAHFANLFDCAQQLMDPTVQESPL